MARPHTNSNAPLLERFWARVQKSANCWLWTKSVNGFYGKFKHNGKWILAHRFSYELHNGPIPAGMFVCHRCDTPACVNPEHLFIGTQADNCRDKALKGRAYHTSGERHARAKLTDADVTEMRDEFARGTPQDELAKRFRITQGSVSTIVNRKTWKHI